MPGHCHIYLFDWPPLYAVHEKGLLPEVSQAMPVKTYCSSQAR